MLLVERSDSRSFTSFICFLPFAARTQVFPFFLSFPSKNWRTPFPTWHHVRLVSWSATADSPITIAGSVQSRRWGVFTSWQAVTAPPLQPQPARFSHQPPNLFLFRLLMTTLGDCVSCIMHEILPICILTCDTLACGCIPAEMEKPDVSDFSCLLHTEKNSGYFISWLPSGCDERTFNKYVKNKYSWWVRAWKKKLKTKNIFYPPEKQNSKKGEKEND